MRRNLNEDAEYNDAIKICVSKIREDDPELDCNKLRDIFVENGADVEGQHGQYGDEPATFMLVSNLEEIDVIDILNDFLGESEYAGTAEDYIISDDIVVEPEFPAYEDVELDPENDALNDEALLEGDNILDDAKDELRGVLAKVNDEIYLSDEGITLDTVLSDDNLVVYSISANGDMDTDEDELVNAFELTDADDIFTLCDVINDALASEYPNYDDVDDEEEYVPRVEKMGHHRRLDEKKKNDCCPGTKKIDEANAIDTVLADIDAKIVNESNVKNDKFYNKVRKALMEKQHSLYPNISYNGKSFDKMTIKELRRIYENVSGSLEELKNRTLNESVIEDKVSETLERKQQLLEYIDNEITYRTTREECLKTLNEDGAEISDEELKNLFGPAQGEEEQTSNNSEENNSDENSEESTEETSDENKDEKSEEEGEVVELSRIVITLKDAEAANDLKQACIEAEIPEDAFELENVEEDEESATEDKEESDDNSEENNEESSEESTEENYEENANESYEYAKYVKALMEGEFGGEQPADNSEESTENPDENTEENSDENQEENSDENKEEDEDKQPKFILTNTDYASKLAQVLNDVYGISKDEFEDMIGGPIVEEDSDENKDDENKEESSEENSENKEDNKENNNEDDEIDPSDLFKNL